MALGEDARAATIEAAVTALVTAALLGARVFGADHYQYLAHPRRAADPTFAVGDWFVGETESYHYTFGFLAERAMVVDGLLAFLVVWSLLTAIAFAIGTVWLVRAMGGTRRTVALAVVVGLAASRMRGWGNLVLLASDALPHFLGTALALVVLAAVVDRRPFAAAVALALTTYVHVNVGMWTGVLVAAAVLVERDRWRQLRWRPALALVAVLLLPLALVVTQDFAVNGAPAGTFDTLFLGRAPHHYLPATAPAATHLAMGTLAAGTVTAIAVGAELRRRLLAVLGVAWGVWMLGLAAAGPLDLVALVRLFPFRLVPIVTMLVVVVLSTRAMAAGGAAPGIALAGFAVAARHPAIGAALGLLAVVALVASPRRTTDAPLSRRDVALVGAVAVIAIIMTGRTFLPSHPGFSPSLPHPPPLATSVAEATTSGEVVMVDPAITGLRWHADRAVVVDFKVFPLDGQSMSAWRERMLRVTGLDPARADEWRNGRSLAPAYSAGYADRSLEDLLDAADTYGADAVVVQTGTLAANQAERAGLPVVTLSDNMMLIRTGVQG